MQIFLDNIVFTIQKAGGVSVYWYELLQGICNAGLSVSFLNAGLNPANIFERQLNYQQHPCIRESWIPPRYLRYLPLQRTLPHSAVFHAGYLRVSPQKNVLNILTIHDFAHERRIATPFPRGLANIKQKAYGIKRADGIICISDSTKRELLHFFPDTDPAKLRVVYHGIADTFHPFDKAESSAPLLPADIRNPYILYVGGRDNYKNFRTAIETIMLLPPKYTLVIAGGGAWHKTERQLLEEKLPGRYFIVENVKPADLNTLYNYAWCLLYPSCYEGFGFPPGEAMKAGCPVVTTNCTSMPEVVGNAGLLAGEITAKSFADQILQLENNQFRQETVSAGIAQASLFTWEKSVRETISFYKDCWNNKFVS
ncbi:glycosyltransferase family 4 protein [Chitinophaga rhizophila]|uniref:Glycosyltransferase family 4 protein n=1 Tax=Chitinophaga rhizophila TaxID=2866212 RepID=A0ABS7GA98_9BACT|nr:glycosyltransferase family 1 protein [Chitinophaga rhizophila]MBW8683729.1 glycosyltransferase family 4 protein [Chitinophaga rhizophila]